MVSILRRAAVLGFSFTVVVGLSSTAFAQANSLFGNSATGGQTANRGSAVGGGAAGGNAAGLGGGAGTAGTGGNALNSGIGATQLGDLSNTVGTGGFVGRSDNAGRFVGNANAAQQTGRGNNNIQGVRAGGNRNVQPGANNSNQLKIRPVHRVAFTFSPRTAAKMNTKLKQQFTRLAERSPRFKGLTLALNGNNEVVLRGTVTSETTKKLAAAMARLEPGVRSVKNEIVVKASK